MSNGILKGKRGIIFGALDSKSIAWKVAEHAKAEGAEIVLTNAPIALRMGTINELAEKINSIVIPADATNMEDLKNLYEKSVEHLGGKIDFVLHSIGMKGYDVSALSFHKTMQAAWELDALNEYGSVIGLSYIAAQRVFHTYNDMADNKAMLESIARSFGYHYGLRRKVRVNTISQSPTDTTAGSGVAGFDGFYRFANDLSPLGNATSDECADYCVSLFSDYTRKVTMQNLFHDGGFSFTGMSETAMDTYLKMMEEEKSNK
jgi:enoyl-[acyl-carrier protein] reductase I